MALSTKPIMLLPPGLPITYTGLFSLKIIVGDIDDRGLFPGSILLATNLPPE